MTIDEIIDRFPFLDEGDFGQYKDGAKSFIVIEETGRDKLIAKNQIDYDLFLEHSEWHPGKGGVAAVKCVACIRGFTGITTFGSVTPDNSDFSYYVDVAEKRAIMKAIRKLLHLSGNILGRDELPSGKVDFSSDTPNVSNEATKKTLDGLIKQRERNAKQKLPK